MVKLGGGGLGRIWAGSPNSNEQFVWFVMGGVGRGVQPTKISLKKRINTTKHSVVLVNEKTTDGPKRKWQKLSELKSTGHCPQKDKQIKRTAFISISSKKLKNGDNLIRKQLRREGDSLVVWEKKL